MSQPIWTKDFSLEEINSLSKNTLVSHLNIAMTAISENTLTGTMPVNETTFQPARLLHGGASCVLAETLGSIAANLCIDTSKKAAVGQHIEATHLRPVLSGKVTGVARPIHVGRTSHTWKIEIFNDDQKLVCDSKIIMAIIDKPTK